MDKPNRIVVIRNDRLGDFMLAYPAFNMLRKLFPDAKIYALVPEYTRPMAELCPWIDKIIIDEATAGFSGLLRTTSSLKKHKLDAALCLHSSPRIAISLFLAGIPHRFAPASRLDQVFYNHRLRQRRSRSEKPEYAYNGDLANYMAAYYGIPPVVAQDPPLLALPADEIATRKLAFNNEHALDPGRKLVIVHAGSGGSAINLSIEQYAELVTLLSADKSLFFILTAGPGEDKIARQLSAMITGIDHVVNISDKGLKDFSHLLALSDLFISGSTGVLHVAGALDTPSVAFYPQKQSATSLRWQTLNADEHRLAFTLKPGNQVPGNHDKIPEIDLELASQAIRHKYF